MKNLISALIVCLFALFYRPLGSKSWSLWAAYDTREAAKDEAKDLENGKGGPYEVKIVELGNEI